MIHCIIVDDEPLARSVISAHLAQYPDWKIERECMNATEAWEALHSCPVQVMFLDVQMPVITGTDFLRSLKNPPLVVFTTAHPHYAVDGFDLMAVDYLLKPVTPDRFRQAVGRVQERLQATLPVSPQEGKSAAPPSHLFLRQDSRLVKVAFDDILFLEARRDFTKVYLKEGSLLASFHLKMLEDLLPADRFLRVHRSYLVALSAVTAIQGNELELGPHRVPVGGNFREALHAALGI